MTIPTTEENSRRYFEELPFHELIELDHESLTEDQLRSLASVLKERRQSGQKRAAAATKESKKTSKQSFDFDRFL